MKRMTLCLALVLVNGQVLWAQNSATRKASSKPKKTTSNNPPPAAEIPRAVEVPPGQFTPPPEAPRFALATWKEMRFESDGFSISFPTKPNESSKTNAQNGVKTTEYEVITADGTYSVSCIKLPRRQPETKEEVKQRLRGMMKQLETGPYKWLGGKEIEVGGAPGVEFKFQYPKLEEISWQRFIAVDEYMYRVIADTIIRKPERKEPQIFMDSFKLLPRTQMVSEDVVPPPPPPAPGQFGNMPKPAIMRVSGGVLSNAATQKVQPLYPQEALAARVAGTVQVAITVSEAGKVIEASAVSGPEALREAAVKAAKQWLFKPVELSGVPVKMQGIIAFNFTLQ